MLLLLRLLCGLMPFTICILKPWKRGEASGGKGFFVTTVYCPLGTELIIDGKLRLICSNVGGGNRGESLTAISRGKEIVDTSTSNPDIALLFIIDRAAVWPTRQWVSQCWSRWMVSVPLPLLSRNLTIRVWFSSAFAERRLFPGSTPRSSILPLKAVKMIVALIGPTFSHKVFVEGPSHRATYNEINIDSTSWLPILCKSLQISSGSRPNRMHREDCRLSSEWSLAFPDIPCWQFSASLNKALPCPPTMLFRQTIKGCDGDTRKEDRDRKRSAAKAAADISRPEKAFTTSIRRTAFGLSFLIEIAFHTRIWCIQCVPIQAAFEDLISYMCALSLPIYVRAMSNNE